MGATGSVPLAWPLAELLETPSRPRLELLGPVSSAVLELPMSVLHAGVLHEGPRDSMSMSVLHAGVLHEGPREGIRAFLNAGRCPTPVTPPGRPRR
jgi:hypothetical protein